VPRWVDDLVVVDDGSRDATARVVREAADRRVHLVRHPENRGVGAALVTGYRAAFARGAEAGGLAPEAMHSFGDSDEAAGAVPELLRAGDTILIKGSRGIRMERISRTLLDNDGDGH